MPYSVASINECEQLLGKFASLAVIQACLEPVWDVSPFLQLEWGDTLALVPVIEAPLQWIFSTRLRFRLSVTEAGAWTRIGYTDAVFALD